MGLLDNQTAPEYYQGNDHGGYQFTSLEAIIAQFEVAYVGENKIIPKINRADIAFHAMRALQELSFDTFKSIKSQQIDMPASLTMTLPQDYVNYTKVSWVDSHGIKHPIYPTRHTSNPFQILQNDDGTYAFGETTDVVSDGTFSVDLENNWLYSNEVNNGSWHSIRTTTPANIENTKQFANYNKDTVTVVDEALEFSHGWKVARGIGSMALAAWQQVDLSNLDTVSLVATADSGDRQLSGATILCDYGIIRIGLTTTNPSVGWLQPNGAVTNSLQHLNADNDSGTAAFPGPNKNPNNYDLGYLEWNDGTVAEKELNDIDVTSVNTACVYIQSFSPWTAAAVTSFTQGANGVNVYDSTAGALDIANLGILPLASTNNTPQKNRIDNISLGTTQSPSLQHVNADKNSSTWNDFKSATPSEITKHDYEDDTYWPYDGNRYGLEPSHAQVNGSFYVDNRLGKINFSSNISGKTVILDYISDSLGTDAEMQVHKFAEDAMYKFIAHAILSTSSYGQGLVNRLTREKFAAIRKAKLRLSSLKLEELTQILRGKSKQIKH